MTNASRRASPLWAITSYFNPVGYQRRRENYRAFREWLDLPLVAAELSFSSQFELGADDAEIHLRITDGDVMWQKERLLNLAVAALPQSCKYVAWLDCDVIFERADWADETVEKLKHVPLVQPFSVDYHLEPNAELVTWRESAELVARSSVVANFERGAMTAATLLTDESDTGLISMGHVWAARRELIERHGLYDARIMGGGDTAVVAAAYGEPLQLARSHCMNEPQAEHYVRWAEPFYDDVQGAVACVDGELLHLWHGHRADRRYYSRHAELNCLGFDPFHDIVQGLQGCWHWATKKPALHRWVRDYFADRREDQTVAQGAA